MGAREDACLHGEGCDGRSHSLFCNDAWFYPPKGTTVAPTCPNELDDVLCAVDELGRFVPEAGCSLHDPDVTS